VDREPVLCRASGLFSGPGTPAKNRVCGDIYAQGASHIFTVNEKCLSVLAAIAKLQLDEYTF
jgi:hypothetical protein